MPETRYARPAEIDGETALQLRKQMNMTQQQFADFLSCSKPTVERMEKNGAKLKGPTAMLLRLLTQHSELLEYYSIPERRAPLRMWYMFRDRPCTLIDVDLVHQRVWIKNYVDHLMFRAFGVNEKPSFQDYEAFLRSRCFPETRDKLKLHLRELDIPFYDPMMIISKTQGRMAEDEFWIRMDQDT